MIRSTLFHVLFFLMSAAMCVAFLPSLLLPRRDHARITDIWVWGIYFLERYVLRLEFQVLGAENLPKGQPFIIASKHQSAYETYKLRLIFRDPAIVLKKELLRVPVWGWYLKKYGVIAIDRSTPEKALRSLQKGALDMKAQDRPIIIYPQGTRVAPGVNKPYKPGVARIQEVTKLPVIPLALNSGAFWPKGAWVIRPGTVTFKILKPIPPGKDRTTVMKKLEQAIEKETNILVAQARTLRHTRPPVARGGVIAAFIILAAFAAYTAWWGYLRDRLTEQYAALNAFRPAPIADTVAIRGYPLMRIRSAEEQFGDRNQSLTLNDVKIDAIPLPNAPIQIQTGAIEIASFRWLAPIAFDAFKGTISYRPNVLNIIKSELTKDDFAARAAGTVDLSEDPPQFDLKIQFKGYAEFLNALVKKGVIDDRTALFMTAGFTALADANGVVSVPVTQQGRTLYAGPFAFAELPEPKAAPSAGAMESPQAPSR